MNFLVRRTTIWAFAAFFGCVSLLGPGWHCVFGHHFHGPESCAHAGTSTSSCTEQCCARIDHRENALPEQVTGESATAANTAGASGPAIGSLAAAAHHCPLCQFFGTAQWSQADARPELVLLASEQAAPAAPSRASEAPRRYLSRAPPRVSA